MAKVRLKAEKTTKDVGTSFFKKYFLQLMVATFALLLYSNSLLNGYNMDDELVTINHRLTSKGILAIPEIFTSPYYQDEGGYAYEYRPVPLATFAIEHSLFGDNAGVSHFFNWLLYAVLCLCLFRLLSYIGGAITPLIALFITLIFCAHPSHTEIVCSIKNRDEILGLLFCILATHVALMAARKSSWWLILPSAGLFLLAMLCKTTFVPFAFLIVLAVIFFAETGLAFIMITSLPLAVVCYFTLDLNPARYRTIFALAYVVAVFVSHFVVKGVDFNRLKLFFSDNKFPDVLPTEVFSGLKLWYSEFTINSLYTILPTLIILLIYGLGRPTIIGTFAIITLLLLITGYLQSKKRGNYWGVVLFHIALCIFLYFAQVGAMRGQFGLYQPYSLYVVLLFLFWWGRPSLRLPAFVLMIVIGLYLAPHDLISFIAPFLLFMCTRLPVGRKIIMVVLFAEIALTLAWLVTGFRPVKISSFSFATLLQFALLLTMVNWGGTWKFITGNVNILATLVAALFICVLVAQSGTQIVYRAETVFYGNKPLPNIVESLVKTKTDRPLHYVEFPITTSTTGDVKVGTSLVVMGHYLTKVIVPFPLAFYYGYSFIEPTSLKNGQPILVLIIYLLLLGAAVFFIRKNKYVSFGLVIYLLSVMIFSGYFFPVPGIIADRYLLIPSLGWSILLGLALFKLFKINDTLKFPAGKNLQLSSLPKGFRYSVALVLCFYTLITFSRNFDWKDDITLMRHDIKYVDKSAQAHNLLALHLMIQTDKEPNADKRILLAQEALGHFKRATGIYPKLLNATFDIGRVYISLNLPDSALAAFKLTLDIDSTFSESDGKIADIYLAKGLFNEAIPYLQAFLKLRPSEPTAYDRLSYVYFKTGQFEKSIETNQQAIKIFPDHIDPVLNISQTYLFENMRDSARFYCQKALVISPGSETATKLLSQIDRK